MRLLACLYIATVYASELYEGLFRDELCPIQDLYSNMFRASQVESTPTKKDIVPTLLPDMGIAMTIRPNEIHVYQLNLSYGAPMYTLSLSECSRTPSSLQPLELFVGAFSGTTSDGGLLQVDAKFIQNNLIRVVAPSVYENDAVWSYELGADLGAAYAPEGEAMYLVDSDFSDALFVTDPLKTFNEHVNDTAYRGFINSSSFEESTQKFSLFLTPATDEVFVLANSYCAVRSKAIMNQNNAVFSVSDRLDNSSMPILKGQFLITELNKSTEYNINLGIPPSEGYVGGVLFDSVLFYTKESESCQLIYNMTNCPETAFSVPGNASVYSRQELTDLYDNYVGEYFTNFSRALDQVNCDDRQENLFSVYSTCQMCTEAYRNWLCTVSVPRCEDWSNNASYLKPREVNQSRNSMINEVIKPGRYKEILPCYWLCWNLGTYCPSLMSFVCPTGEDLNSSYGYPSDNGDISCSYPGASYSLKNGASIIKPYIWTLIVPLALFF